MDGVYTRGSMAVDSADWTDTVAEPEEADGKMNQVTIIGRLGKNPELRSTTNGTPVCTLSIAVDNAGNEKGEAGWFDVVCWGKLAESVCQYLHKGSRVAVSGRLQQRKWKTDGGDNRSVVEVVAFAVDFLDPKPQGQDTPQQQDSAPAQSDDDPFADGGDDPFA